MATHRFFVPPEWIDGQQVTLVENLAHQIRTVLRLKVGDRVIILDNRGREYEVSLAHIGHNVVTGRVLRDYPASGEPGVRIVLYQAVLKARKFEWVLQKGTELGISEFVPTICHRSVTGQVSDVERKGERWQRIIQEAAEQSWRGRLPVLQPALFFGQACQRARDASQLRLVPWEDEKDLSLKQALTESQEQGKKLDSVSLFVGPEGGLTADEIGQAVQYGILPVSLGPRILRAETAGLAAASAIFYELDS